jgi:hypothetical protein
MKCGLAIDIDLLSKAAEALCVDRLPNLSDPIALDLARSRAIPLRNRMITRAMPK